MTSSANQELASFSSWINHVTLVKSFITNKPLALKGHVTNASLKLLVVVLLMSKTDETHKNYLTSEI